MSEPQQLIWLFYFFAIGACVGSFLNVVIYRLPENLSLIKPGSHCPKCKTPIRAYNNIPIFSYIILRGKCASCGESFSPRYMLIEVLTAILFAACYQKFGLTIPALIYMMLTASLVAVIFIDLDHMIIPDEITIPGIIIGFICSYFFLSTTMTNAFLGFAIGGGLFLIIALLVPHGMGGGDIKLMAMIGAFLGLVPVLMTIFLGSLIGSIIGGAAIIFGGKDRKAKIPFGPYLVMGALLAIFYQGELIHLYLDIFVPQ